MSMGNREIKFRALVKYSTQYDFQWEYYSTLSEPIWNDKQIAEVKVKDLQYTDLKDKNGKEIYEGDIIKMFTYTNNKNVWEIRFGGYMVDGGDYYSNYTTAGFYAFSPFREKDDDTSSINIEANGGVEIIGNAYENPELLK